MKFGQHEEWELDAIDRRLLGLLQDDCRTPLVRLGEAVGLSAPAVLERVKKLEQAKVIEGYHALLDAKQLGLDITAFIGVVTSAPDAIDTFEERVSELADVLECHHVTGSYTLLLKAKTANTTSLERLISRIRAIGGVARTETMVVLSTHTERVQVSIGAADDPAMPARRGRKTPERTAAVRRA